MVLQFNEVRVRGSEFFLVFAPSSRPDENLTPSNWQTFFTLTLLINFAPFRDETKRTGPRTTASVCRGLALHYSIIYS